MFWNADPPRSLSTAAWMEISYDQQTVTDENADIGNATEDMPAKQDRYI
jgi:hypothetical protein